MFFWALVIAYSLGCIATGYYLVRWRTKQDIRTVGSGTTGAMNVARLLGTSGFIIVCLGDFLKGVAVLVIAQALGINQHEQFLALLAVVAGHNFPMQLRFRGGNGLATTSGAVLVFHPVLFLLLLVYFIGVVLVIFLLKKLTALPIKIYTPSKILVLSLPLIAWLVIQDAVLTIGFAVLVMMIMGTILQNFRRLHENRAT